MPHINLVAEGIIEEQAISYLTLIINGESYTFWYIHNRSAMFDMRFVSEWINENIGPCEFILSGGHRMSYSTMRYPAIADPEEAILYYGEGPSIYGNAIVLDFQCIVRADPATIQSITFPTERYFGSTKWPRDNPTRYRNMNSFIEGCTVNVAAEQSLPAPAVDQSPRLDFLANPLITVDRHSPDFAVYTYTIPDNGAWPSQYVGLPTINILIDHTETEEYVYSIRPVPWEMKDTIVSEADVPDIYADGENFPSKHMLLAYARDRAKSGFLVKDVTSDLSDALFTEDDTLLITPVPGYKHLFQFTSSPLSGQKQFAFVISRRLK